MTIAEALEWGRNILSETSGTALLDCELLLSHILDCARISLISRSKELLNGKELEYKALVSRRARHEPVAYLLGEKEFWGLEFFVNPDVLIPRPETEILVEWALEELNERSGTLNVIDLGTGSGCIVISLAVEARKRGLKVEFTATDISQKALEIAEANAKRHKVADMIRFINSDWFANVDKESKFDLILSNPPYISEGDKNVSASAHFEPQQALYADCHGMKAIKSLIKEAPELLKKKGALLMEFGRDQDKAIEQIAPGKITFRNDLAGIKRAVKLLTN
jgi:release factor glutamine methyltransferase